LPRRGLCGLGATCFAVVFVAELPDKTVLARPVLGTRYRAWFVFAGVAAAFTVHVGIAVSAGSLLLLQADGPETAGGPDGPADQGGVARSTRP
jgi:hypothetical protein